MLREGYGGGEGCARRGEAGRNVVEGQGTETEGAAMRVKWNGRAGVEQKARDGTRRSMTERNGAEKKLS